ncbi:MAG: hypothetical protein ACI8S3_000956 [Alphaproteobacteria bacterium]|jgi:hypothetical protein
MRANFRHRHIGPELGHQHLHPQNHMMGAAVAPAEHIDLAGDQVPHRDGGYLLFAGVLPPAFEGSHGISGDLTWNKNITRTFSPVNIE